MVSSITTTVSVIVISSVTGDLLTAFGVGAILTLIALLAVKKLAASARLRFKPFDQNLNIVIFPLLFVFCVSLFMKVWEVLY